MWGFFTPTAELIKQALGDDNFFSIGMTYGKGKFWNKWQNPDERFVDSCIPWNTQKWTVEESLSKCGDHNFFLNWGMLPLSDFTSQYWMNSNLSVRDDDTFYKIEPREWDACIYLDEVNPATPYNMKTS